MIFISGIHGVGKSFFCSKAHDFTGLNSYSASSLIVQQKRVGFDRNKLIPDISDNQQYLLSALNKLAQTEEWYLLDGHFCLLNAQGQVERIPLQTFTDINPSAIILLTENAEVIAQRRTQRDGVYHSLEDIIHFQDEEIQYAKEVSEFLSIPLFVSRGTADLDAALSFIQTIQLQHRTLKMEDPAVSL